MATAQKPRTKKKKRTREKRDDDPVINLVFPATATRCDDVLSHDCFVSAEFKALTVEEHPDCTPLDLEVCKKIEDISIEPKEECSLIGDHTATQVETEAVDLEGAAIVEVAENIQSQEPSAPIMEEFPSVSTKPGQFLPVVKYPDLSYISMTEMRSQNQAKYKIKSDKTKPFTSAQLREIYCCKELETAKQFEVEFLDNSLQETFVEDPLYNRILQYSVLRSKLKVNVMDAQSLQKTFTESTASFWDMEDKSIQYNGVCGDGITVRDTESYKVAMLNLGKVETACLTLEQLHELVCFNYTTNLVYSQVIRMQIEQIIREILTYPVFLNKNQSASVSLKNKPDTDAINCITHLRRAISILFIFVRKPFPDKVFLNDIRSWITKLVSLHLRIATKEDHWFLLLHIMRCPSGVSLWATSFLQVPEPDVKEMNVLNSLEVNHCIAVLGLLLMPIKKRNEFLKAFSQSHKDISDPVKEDLWILVDSDGEEGSNSFGECVGLKESDLIAFLNQIPFESLFTAILNIEKKNSDYIILPETISGNQVIKVIAFNSTLIELLGQGLITYNTERYKQFAKRLGRLIRQSIQYIADLRQIFMENNLSKSPELCDRLNVEFNAFVIKACSYIYKTRNLGTWQYFSSLPFASLDSDAIWQLLYYLNVGFPAELPPVHEEFRHCLNVPNFWEKFNASIADILHEDLYYILQSFFEIAIERDPVRDLEIIQSICSHIFLIGFVNDPTKEICYKTCRDMLINLTNVHPELISNLMHQTKNRFLEIDNILYLFKSLPLDIWKPEMDTFEILANWLLNYNYETLENLTARLIISRLNWGFDKENNLFLPYDIHVRMACLICEASTKHTPELVGSSGISESVRQVSGFAENQTNREQFVHWCWHMASTLRLHLIDQNPETIRFTLQNPSAKLSHIAELETLGPIFQGVSENRPLAIYFSILLSLWGHSVPLICQKGFPKLRFLLNDYRHSVVIRCIQLIVPLFLDCSDILRTSESFQELLKALLTADRTYIKMAKELISSTSPGPILELMQNMIQAQLIYYTEYGLSTPTPLINLWLQVLTNTTIWQNPNAAYLVDNVLKVAYQFGDSWRNGIEYFRDLYKDSEEWKISKGSTLKILLGSATQTEKPPVVSADCPWLALIILELEFETQEQQTSLWPELLRQLAESTGKTNIDHLLKKTATIVGCPSFPASTLVLYKYANLIASLDVKHPLLPIISQKFFWLYLARVPFHTDEERFQHIYGVSDKFYEHNISLMKKLKSKFKQAEEYYVNAAARHVENEALAYLHTSCAKLMKTYLLWLEETCLNKISKNQNIDLPPQYNVGKLKDLFLGDNRDWTEFLHFPTIRQEQTDCATRWLKMFCKLPVLGNASVNITTLKSTSTPLQRIKNHLQSYDKPVSPPELISEQLILKSLTPRDIDGQTLTILKNYFKIVDKFSSEFYLTVKELNALTGNYKDLIPSLYKNVPYKEKRILKCTSILSNFTRTNCAKPAEITIELEKPQKNVSIEQKIESNREKHDIIITRLLEQNVEKLVIAMQNMEHVVKYLKTFRIAAKNSAFDSNYIADVAIQFFFDIIKNYNENIASFPPANELCPTLLLELGFFIQEEQETQGIRILDTALKRPELINVLSDLFVPSRTRPEYFLNMYKFLIDSHMKRCDTKIIFVLMSKFDLQNWLQEMRPKLSEISQLLKYVFMGLENWNQPETTLLQDLFRRHLIHIYEHKFPEHYGEVLQKALASSSDQKLMPVVLIDLLNSLLIKSNTEILSSSSNFTPTPDQLSHFATQQNLFTFSEISDTIKMFARHFQGERLQHGLHGLYPKHKSYCQAFSLWFSFFGHAATASAICSYNNVLGDTICDILFEALAEMYAPWLVIYSGQSLQQYTANWIRQLIANGKLLYPWSELHTESAKIMISSFINCLQYVLDSLPVSSGVMGHVFNWYFCNFTSQEVTNYIRAPLHAALVLLPWERFQPQIQHIGLMLKILQEYLPECHSFFGHIFLRIKWKSWFRDIFNSFNAEKQGVAMQLILAIFIQISFEPYIHDDELTHKILEESLNYPWHLVEYQGLESIFNWIVLSVEPTIILKIPTESNNVDKGVLRLLQIASGMLVSNQSSWSSTCLTKSKRLLYVRTIVRLLRTCATKHNKLLATKEGVQTFTNAVVELIVICEQTAVTNNTSRKDNEMEAQHLAIEIIGSLSSQSQLTSKLFIDAIITWQDQCEAGSPMLCGMLHAIGMCKTLSNNMHALLEATICNYFRHNDDIKDIHSPAWTVLLQKLRNVIDLLDLAKLLGGPYLLAMHCYILHKIGSIADLGSKITFLQDISQLLEGVKTNEATEAKIAVIWGSIISYGCKILEISENAKKPLLMLARYLQVISAQSEGWGEGLLEVIGLKRGSISNKKKILTRCLSCIIFALFPDASNGEPKFSQEFLLSLEDLKVVSNNKKYADVKVEATLAIGLIEENPSAKSDQVIEKIYNIIRLLYNDSFLTNLLEVWSL